jgi:hypothetical protein
MGASGIQESRKFRYLGESMGRGLLCGSSFQAPRFRWQPGQGTMIYFATTQLFPNTLQEMPDDDTVGGLYVKPLTLTPDLYPNPICTLEI